MVKMAMVLLAWIYVLEAQEVQCFDIGGVNGSYVYELQKGKSKVTYQCMNTIASCSDLDSNACKRLSKDLLRYIKFVEIKNGFLITQSCLDEGLFYDCPLMEYRDNTLPLLLIDEKGHTYKLDLKAIKASKIDKLILKRMITVQGHYIGDHAKIKVDEIFEQVPLQIKNAFRKDSKKD